MLAPAWTAAAQDYTVRPGDTLSQIAERHDVPGGWPALWRLNRAAVDDPDLIFPGQELRLDRAGPRRDDPRPRPDGSTSDDGPAGTVRPATGGITSPYGMRTHPITGVRKLHSGTDYGYGDGLARAARAGAVSVSHPAWAGNLVTIGHGGGVRTRYAHLAAVSVGDGENVSAGDVVGRIGSRGYSTGPHLHFEVLRHGEFIDPERWLR